MSAEALSMSPRLKPLVARRSSSTFSCDIAHGSISEVPTAFLRGAVGQ